MLYTITNSSMPNGRPSSIGNRVLSLENRTDHVFTVANFTTETTPPYSDPEGDAMSYVKIISLPTTGRLTLNGVDISQGDLIQSGSISTGNFKYVPGDIDEAYSETLINFDLADTGSNSVSGLPGGILTISVGAVINLPPNAVGDNSVNIEFDEIYAFTEADFTTNTTPPYSDPEGDAPSRLKILSLPLASKGTLYFNAAAVQVNQIINFSEINYLNYVPELNQSNASLALVASFRFAIADAGSEIFTEN